ncbi:MAG: alpha/beta hydrolase [Anaerolineales bacterium]
MLKLSRKQLIVLAGLALVNLLVITVMGVVILRSLNADPLPPSPQVRATGVPPTSTPRPLPPTWTPEPTPTPFGMETLYAFVPEPCPFEVPEGVQVECGVVGVPETRRETPEGLVRLSVAIYHSHSSAPAEDPVVFLNGGPGSGAVDLLSQVYMEFILPLLASRDVVVFDQRGTGFSEPDLNCPEFSQVIKEDLEKTFSLERQAEEYSEALRRCRTRLANQGVNVAAYTSAENAADVKDLIQVLGYEQANLYGASYGTRLALTVMRDHPEVVRSVVLDGVEPVEVLLFNDHGVRMDRLLQKLFAGCAADRACRAAYPNLERTYTATVARLDEEPVEIWTKSIGHKSYHMRIDGGWVDGAVFNGAYQTEMIRYFPYMLEQTYDGDYELLSWMLGGVGREADLSIGMYFSVNCHEEVFATTPEELAADFAAYPNVERFAKRSIYGRPETLFTLCEVWGAAPFDPREGMPVESDIPALILVGEYDPITPPAYARQVADRLSASYFYEFPGQGHVVGVWQSFCAGRVVRSFLEDPAVEPDAGCITEMGGPDFFIP